MGKISFEEIFLVSVAIFGIIILFFCGIVAYD